jgi:predicted metal-dependent hydrolase
MFDFLKHTKSKSNVVRATMMLDSTLIDYSINRKAFSRVVRLSISRQGGVRITCPLRYTQSAITSLLLQKKEWILSHHIPQKTNYEEQKKLEAIDYKHHKENAFARVVEIIERANKQYGFSYKGIRIKNQKTLWGSCSRNGMLNFNYKIIHLTDEQAHYIVAHELCHLKEFNHGRAFWNLVAETVPQYKQLRHELRAIAMKTGSEV